MKYLCLVYCEPHALAGLGPEERAALDRDSVGYDRELQKAGHFIAASALQPARTAKTIRVRRGQATVTDGPFAETKEVLAGFIFIDASDPSEALRIAEKIPMARYGSIEVRPELSIGAP